MDWQHLLMNGEHLPEYAALLDAEGLLGHQHANSGWGIFDDDNMVGATAFMETLELALEFRRCGYGHGDDERLGFDLFPYTEDQVAAVERCVKQWRFIDSRRGADRRRGAARGPAAQGRRARLRAGVRGARGAMTRSSASTSARRASRVWRSTRTARSSPGPRRATRCRRRGRAGPSRTPRTGGARRRRCSRSCAAGDRRSGCPGQMHGLVALDARRPRCCGRRSSGTTSARRPSATRSRRASGRAPGRADRQPRADRLHRARSCCGCGATSPRCTRASPA